MTSSSPSGLQITTRYYFKVNGTEYNILTGGPIAPTFQEVAILMKAAVTGDEFDVVITGTAPLQDIRVINTGVKGWASTITLAFGSSGPNLWTNLNGFVAFDTAVPGRGNFSLILVAKTPTGGIILAGAAITSYSTIAPVGSIRISGAAIGIQVAIIYTTVTAAITISGAAFYNKVSAYVASGGVTLSGAALYVRELAYASSGGALLSGVAVTISDRYYSYIPSGTAILSGMITKTIEFIRSASGSAIIAGSSVTNYNVLFSYISSGSIILSGTSPIEKILEYKGLYYGTHYYPFDNASGTTVNDKFANHWTWIASGSAVLSGTALYEIEYGELIVAGASSRLGSWDGINWKNYDGTGTGTGPYNNGTVVGGDIRASTIYNGYLVVAGDSGRLGSFDGTNWKNYDGTGTGTGPYNNATVIGTSRIYALTVYNGYLIVAGDSGRLGSFDGTNWKNYDGSGTGTGPYSSTVIGFVDFISALTVYGSYLVAAGGRRLGSFDGTNWKNYNGTGTGTGPYNSASVLGTSLAYTLTVYDSYLVVAGDNGRLGSWDGTNWKNYDGGGTGTGPYNNNTVTESLIYASTVYDSYLVVAGDSGYLGSWDGTNWKNYDGGGTGTGPYNNATVIGTSYIYALTVYDGYLVVAGNNSRLGSWDGANWKNYDGGGTGIGPYDNATVIDTTIWSLTVYV